LRSEEQKRSGLDGLRTSTNDREVKPAQIARWVVRSVPGVYGAARAAGLGRRDAVRVLQASAYALVLARRRYPKRWRAENAVRHFVWQAWIAAAYGTDVAESIGRAHERLAARGAAGRADSAVDRENNHRGQAYGVAHAERIRASATRPALSALADEAGRLWDAGQLRPVT
jgi:hypothetical protein